MLFIIILYFDQFFMDHGKSLGGWVCVCRGGGGGRHNEKRARILDGNHWGKCCKISVFC